MYLHRPWAPCSSIRYSTGISKLDMMLNGGLEPGEILEIYGKSSTGKSQLAQTILKTFCQNPPDLTSLYVDSKNDLVSSRLFNMFKQCPQAMRRVRVIRENTLGNILKVLKYFEQELAIGQSHFCEKLQLIVVDSLPMIFYGTKTNDSEDWRKEVEKFVAQLKIMSQKYGLIIILINHAVTMQSVPGTRIRQDIVKPALGKQWLQIPNFRISVVRGHVIGTVFRATLEKSTRGPLNQYFDFHITELGVE